MAILGLPASLDQIALAVPEGEHHELRAVGATREQLHAAAAGLLSVKAQADSSTVPERRFLTQLTLHNNHARKHGTSDQPRAEAFATRQVQRVVKTLSDSTLAQEWWLAPGRGPCHPGIR